MGHITLKGSYDKLQKRLDQNIIGAPDSKVLREILSIVFTEEQAAIAVKMPYGFCTTGKISRITGIPKEELQPKLELMAEKGILFDIESKGKEVWYLNPTVIGFFEFSMMRIRDEYDQKELAHKLHEYMLGDAENIFLNEVGKGETQLFRPLVHEDTVDESVVEILDYEKAVGLVSASDAWAVGLCHCRHVAEHEGKECKKMNLESCLTLGAAARYFLRRGMGREITKEECLDILYKSRKAGLVQMGDNVQKNIMFICNCCACCCVLLEGYRRLAPASRLHTSNFVAAVNRETCTMCGLCAKVCPVDAIDGEKVERKTKVTINDELCIGCGVCATKCKFDSMEMRNRPYRVHTPANAIEKAVRMALERGKLHNLMFDIPDSLSHSVLRLVFKALLALPPGKQILAREQVKSRFVRHFLKLAKSKPGADM